MPDYIQINYLKEKTALAEKTRAETQKYFDDNPKKSVEWKIAVNRIITEKTKTVEMVILADEVSVQQIKNWADFDLQLEIEKGVIQSFTGIRKPAKEGQAIG